MSPVWSKEEIAKFLLLNGKGIPADGIACGLVHRTKAAVQGMRRKLKRLRELGASSSELAALLQVHEGYYSSLPEILQRAREPLVPVKPFIRRNRVTGRPLLVSEHKRNGATP
jgi:hypothetical protein